jgi:gluconate 5-dehydrogenase
MSSLKQLFDLSGQTAVVSGGSRGLGLQICEALGEFGAHVVVVARKQAELNLAIEALTAKDYSAEGVSADLADVEAPRLLVEQILVRHGKLDILVNNAGVSWGGPAEDHALAGWNKVMALNLTSVFLLAQAAAKASMIPRRGGRIINMASVEGLKAHAAPMVGTVAYNTSKGGVVNMTRALAAEWGPYGITVNAIAPGYFPSKMTRGVIDEHEPLLLARTPLGRLGGPDDIKGAALLLASAAGAHITGQTLVVDGGWTAI